MESVQLQPQPRRRGLPSRHWRANLSGPISWSEARWSPS